MAQFLCSLYAEPNQTPKFIPLPRPGEVAIIATGRDHNRPQSIEQLRQSLLKEFAGKSSQYYLISARIIPSSIRYRNMVPLQRTPSTGSSRSGSPSKTLDANLGVSVAPTGSSALHEGSTKLRDSGACATSRVIVSNMIDPVTAFLIASTCIKGLTLAVKGLKGLFKWIKRWLSGKFKLKEFINMVNRNKLLETENLANRLLANPEVMRHAQTYALRVQSHGGVQASTGGPTVEESSYDTGDEWEGESCPGSSIDDSDWDENNSDTDEDDRDADEDGSNSDEDDRDADEDSSNSDEDGSDSS
ncbi:MAG: hypothetical protein M1830_006423 [Pleopsidium flavum]|nr:MAG: hypothetical protein M1830_006423 [Pleopsidium flavum]